ncbi:hypothetical protein BCR36DRAFT_405853 [Piromyces finnis]|uniref:Uncharacterized protein n=1 Tax=Piromyces finnis TaxID=1754191 RepID=A0A1Y1V2S8_9FUNG|nr:hypothetical protein BCR36DRAFT_405853 [Piromyces finnis]|eukprot:ORX45994.1 hypothetical protein BCR36DRAFT_405853 [Piromyces finnis]
MGIKSKIKGSYAYTQWKLGKYTKRRVKTSVSPEWAIERQEYERERANSYSEDFYNNRDFENYRAPVVRNNVVNYPDFNNGMNETRSIPRPVSTTIANPSNLRRDMNGNPIRYSAIEPDKYSRITLQKSDFDDVLVPSRNYTLVQKSNSSSVAYYSQNNTPNRNSEILVPRNYGYTTNAYPSRNYERRNI